MFVICVKVFLLYDSCPAKEVSEQLNRSKRAFLVSGGVLAEIAIVRRKSSNEHHCSVLRLAGSLQELAYYGFQLRLS